MADAGTRVDVIIAEGGAHQLLHQVGLFVGAARGGDATGGIAAVLALQAPELGSGVVDRLFPAHLAPGLTDLGADHGLGDAVGVGGIADGEAALNAGVAVVGMAVHVRHHAHHLGTAYLGAERTAHAAVGAGGDDAVFGLTLLDQRFLGQRGSGTRLHAGAAGDTLGVKEGVVLAGGDL